MTRSRRSAVTRSGIGFGVWGWRDFWEFLANLVLEVGGDEHCDPVWAAGGEGGWGGFGGRAGGAWVGFFLAVGGFGGARAGDGHGDDVGVGCCSGDCGAQGQDEGEPLRVGEHG